jgi:hypothetical protein
MNAMNTTVPFPSVTSSVGCRRNIALSGQSQNTLTQNSRVNYCELFAFMEGSARDVVAQLPPGTF